jgi:O-antigen/teichoic acid export membrane protein
LLILTNLLFIPLYGIAGAALASLISKVIFGFAKYFFLFRVYRLQPFDWNYLKLTAISVLVYLTSLWLPTASNYLVDIVFRGSFILASFTVLVYFTEVSVDINQRIDALTVLIINIFKKA